MRGRLLQAIIITTCALTGVNASAPEAHTSSILKLAGTLAKTSTGATLIEKAFRKWAIQNLESIEGHLFLGEISKTDATLTRQFDTETGEESRIREVRVIINREQSFQDQVLDLAHELTHATQDPSWDPYDPDLNVVDYVKASIEGAGGEADAVMSECQVATELGWSKQQAARRCTRYKTETLLDRAKVLADFYRVGHFYSFLKERMGLDLKKLAYLSSESAELLSSTGKTPYPVALVKEYEELTRVACENSRRRIASDQSDQNRALIQKRCGVARI